MINKDRPYAEEAAYVASKLRGRPNVLEFGCGTGRHGKILAALGFHVHGIDLSLEMVEFAHCIKINGNGSFEAEVGDIRSIELDKQFDAVIALFHVLSYQISIEDFTNVIRNAARHLKAGGLFIFDVWHGPAVAFQGLKQTEKIVPGDNCSISRRALPSVAGGIATIDYEFDVIDNGEPFHFTERHKLRYFHPEFVQQVASKYFKIIKIEEMLTGADPSVNTWSITYVLERM